MELPFETYERVTGQKWPGGKTKLIRLLLRLLYIDDEPGTAAANLELQAKLKRLC
jgi:hypothetical protein